MDTQELSIGLALQKTQEQAAIQVQSMTMTNAQEQSDALMKMLENVEVITDPNLGNLVNILA